MYQSLYSALAPELHQPNQHAWTGRGARSKPSRSHDDELALRSSRATDRAALLKLGQLDNKERVAQDFAKAFREDSPEHVLVVTATNGRLVAAISVADGCAIADPFYPSAAAVELLRVRARQLRGSHRPRWSGLAASTSERKLS